MLSIPFFCLPRPFLQLTPTGWMSALKSTETLWRAITVQNYIPPVARTHRTRTQAACVEATPTITSDSIPVRQRWMSGSGLSSGVALNISALTTKLFITPVRHIKGTCDRSRL